MIVYSGATKKKSRASPESTAANIAGQKPPIIATTTTRSWKASTSLAIDSIELVAAKPQVSNGPTMSAVAKPAMRRRRVSPPVSRGRVKRMPAWACATMCTSMSPDSR